MRVHLALIALIGLILLAGAGSAVLIPDQNSSISSSANWTVVNQQSTIIIAAMNGTSGINGATVSVALSNTTMGSLVMASSTTDASGTVTGIFTAGTKSGAVNIMATITYPNSTPIIKNVTQYIDHDVAYSVLFDYDSTATVGTETLFNMSFTDRWGNPIDSRKEDALNIPRHSISLHIGSVTGAGAFDKNGTYVQDLTQNLDPNGNASVTVRTDIVGGENIIWLKPFGAITDQYKSIIGMTDAAPAGITISVLPSGAPPAIPTDGVSNFTFIYTLKDKYGNVAGNQTIQLHTNWSGDSDTNFISNENGQIYLTYGPHDTAAFISVTATSLTNTSVTNTTVVWFYSTAPVNMELTASPQTMGSLETNSSIRSIVSAEVTDIEGNPVSGQTVTFYIGTPWYDATYNKTYTIGPAWESTTSATVTGVTDTNGFATVNLKPGSFDNNVTDINYTQQATGHVTVTASWSNATSGASAIRSLQVNWKNYPYLSVDTEVNPLTIPVNGTVDLTIKLKGDGYALQQNVADVVLVTDLSGSMTDSMSPSGTKLSNTITALQKFVAMSGSNIFIGLASFANAPQGYSTAAYQLYKIEQNNGSAYPFNPYDSIWDRIYQNSAPQNAYSDARIDLNLTTSTASNNLNSTITSYSANGGTCIACGLNAGLSELNTKGYPGHTKTIILMTDGIANLAPINSTYPLLSYMPSDYVSSNGGSSLIAKNAAIYVATNIKAQNIKIYTIAFGSDADNTTLTSIASPGCAYSASNGTALATVYQTINGLVSTQAGVNTTMSVGFSNVNVSGVTFPGASVYSYIYNSSVTSGSTRIQWQDGVTNVTNQTDTWNANHALNFTIGTIMLNQTWQADILFQVMQPGNIKVFDNSSIIFNNGSASLSLPVKYINVIANLSNPGWSLGAIQLSNLQANPAGNNITAFLPVTWNLTYPGNITKSATERIFYSNDNQQSWVQFDTQSGIAPCTNSPQYSQLDVRGLPAGTYYIKVHATADDAIDDEKIMDTGIWIGPAGRSYIKLE
jgi:hypothetical protein